MAARAATAASPNGERLARGAERTLRLLGDARLGLGLLLATGLANLFAAFDADEPPRLDGWPYAVLLGAVALSAVAAVAVRAPATWREWRRPAAVQPGRGALVATLPARDPLDVARVLHTAGYRARVERGRRRWAVHATRRGWSRFSGQASHLALVVIILGAAIGAAFGSETVASLVPGDQALLDAPRPGFSSAVRLESFDTEFGPDGRPRVLDTTVTFLRDGEPVRTEVLRVNEPGDFDGYLVHAWTYGPAVRLRVTTLAGSTLLDAPVPLADERDGVPVGSIELPTVGVTLGLALADAEANVLGASVIGPDGLVDSARLRLGEDVRIGPVRVRLESFDAWVTLMSRRDPGLAVLFAGAGLLCASLAVAFWLPRRRVTVRPRPAGGLSLVLRGERFDRPADEVARLERMFGTGP